jgi:hypothetical protein
LDHILPQSYLDGFISDAAGGTLSVLDLQQLRWFESGTRSVAAVRGFYDYAPGIEPDQTADEAFAKLEARFPNVRKELISDDFSGWASQLDFLLEYAQMLRARSKLFREHALTAARQSTMLRVEEVVQEPGTTKMKVKPLVLDEADRETLLRNMTITTMRGEIARGAGVFAQLHWCLRFTTESANPVITADDAVIVQGRAPSLDTSLQDRETLIFFPVCWQACLIGSPAKFDTETDAFLESDLRMLQRLYLKSDCRFAYSPVRLGLAEAG